jgi:hypothetical protein
MVCTDVTNRGEFRDEWFLDVKAVVCVARPRAGKHGDQEAYMSLIQNLSDAVCDNGVPHMLLLSIPYLDRLLFGSPVASQAMQASQLMSVLKRFVAAEDSKLSIVRIAELSEIGILLDTFRKSRVWPRIIGYNHCVQPISAGDFATAVANLLIQEPIHVDWRSKFLWGGPHVYTWRQVGSLIQDAIGKGLFFISIPLLLAHF